jgi:hypothetical protein
MRRRYSKQHGRNKRQYHQKRYGESLERLEEEMFEPSVLAGIAGNYQWGLDACWMLGITKGAGIHMEELSTCISTTERAVKTSMR